MVIVDVREMVWTCGHKDDADLVECCMHWRWGDVKGRRGVDYGWWGYDKFCPVTRRCKGSEQIEKKKGQLSSMSLLGKLLQNGMWGYILLGIYVMSYEKWQCINSHFHYATEFNCAFNLYLWFVSTLTTQPMVWLLLFPLAANICYRPIGKKLW